jgi:hypothetical protein
VKLPVVECTYKIPWDFFKRVAGYHVPGFLSVSCFTINH